MGLLVLLPSVSVKGDDTLVRINSAIRRFRSGELNQREVYSQVNELLESQQTPESKGALLVHFIQYLNSAEPSQWEIISFYSTQALKLPLEPPDLVQVLNREADVAVSRADATPLADRRLAYLAALKARIISLDASCKYLKEDKRTPLPAVSKFEFLGPPDDPKAQALIKMNEDEMKQREYFRQQNALIYFRDSAGHCIERVIKRAQFSEKDVEEILNDVTKNPKVTALVKELAKNAK